MNRPTIGALNKYAVIRKRTDFPTGDVANESDEQALDSTYPTLFNRWVNITPVGGSTYLLGAQTGIKITHRVKMRYCPKVDSDYEVVYKDTVYRVHRNTDIEGTCRFTLLEVEELNHRYTELPGKSYYE